MTSTQAISFVVARRFRDGTTTYVVFLDGKYWHASDWEYRMIQKGHHPEELGMFAHDSDEEGGE